MGSYLFKTCQRGWVRCYHPLTHRVTGGGIPHPCRGSRRQVELACYLSKSKTTRFHMLCQNQTCLSWHSKKLTSQPRPFFTLQVPQERMLGQLPSWLPWERRLRSTRRLSPARMSARSVDSSLWTP